ncbi:sulfotransferase family 2 domain-containing protein [Marinicella sp. S1101]|uniref:sulfotransferase family 2 domain-containing protein n=1 Tax=Marinicella marina TaxID=2996016 RepID=UPI002260EB14|nr:sulfotransferase family 2 domain-containing protein [Marinicella marina]MCX7553346.1 sulfotransferase family 2 domain-containing protein [Marinicella marina]MDJ1139078.1 sulfotransferase family 2 domain-containing protein [Marinicella marina]
MNWAKRALRTLKQGRRKLKRKSHTLPLWYDEPDFIFIHINKTAGSSVEKALNLPFEHLTAQEKQAEVGMQKWQDKFTFSFVRNPFDKVCSHYRYRVKTNQTQLKDKPLSFSDWVALSYGEKKPFYYDQPRMFMPQTDWLCDEQGQIMVDAVYHFESLQEDFQTIKKKFGLSADLPHLKPTKPVSYQTFYDNRAKQIIEQHFAADLDAFGYEF